MVRSSIEDLPPFPEGLNCAPISTVSSRKLLDKDSAESAKVLEACQTYGFFYLDLTDSAEGEELLEDAETLLALAQEAFGPTRDEKMKFERPIGGNMFGYKPAGVVKKTDPQLRPDMTEFFNVSKDHMHGFDTSRNYPQCIENARPQLKSFTQRAHEHGMIILQTLARQMGVHESAFTDLNIFEKPSGDHVRFTKKPPRSPDRNAVGLPSHTDFGSVTVLFNWLGGLQIQSQAPDTLGEWVWVRPLPGRAIINLGMPFSISMSRRVSIANVLRFAGDAMVKFSNGTLKSAKHRVVPSPGAQKDLDRYSIVYFVRPHGSALMAPVDKFAQGTHIRVGGKVSVGDDDNTVYTASEWMVKRAIQMGS